MAFNTYVFIFAFLPLFLLVYFLLGRAGLRVRKALIILGSAVFYLAGGWQSAAVLSASLAVNYALAILLRRKPGKRWPLVLGLLFNAGLLFGFKYLDFAAESFRFLTSGNPVRLNLWLPLGISFFTFQQIMYLVSVRRKDVEVRLPDYLAFVLFFPKLIMGPLMEPKDFVSQLNDPALARADWGNLASGLKLFSLGLFRKALLADTFARAVEWGFVHGVASAAGEPAATSYDLLLVMLCYSFQIYFDFSGYSDMAMGVARMMNLELPLNFDSPYRAVSVRDFWHRWHMTLTSFLTKYIYYPLGGSRRGTVRTCANILLVFLISGLWHGASWTFVLWGLLHGLLQVLERLCEKGLKRIPAFLRWGMTFLSINLLWLLFRAESVRDWLGMTGRMLSMKYRIVSDGLIRTFTLPEGTYLLQRLHLTHLTDSLRGFWMILFLGAAFLICLLPGSAARRMEKRNPWNLILCALLFVWAVLCLGGESLFVYNQF